MIKLITSDMDGTLLDENGNLPEEFGQILAELKKRGVIFAPASGRQYFSLRKIFDKYKEDLIFFAENGTMVIKNDKELFSRPMNREVALSALDTAAKGNDNIFLVFCGKKDAYALNRQNRSEYVDELLKYYTHSCFVENFADVEDECIKVSFYDASGNSSTVIYPLVEKFKATEQVVLSSAYWVDITAAGVNKGSSIRQMQKRLGITPDECAAFGDFLNDKEMLQAVTYSFAMANAHPDIKKIARFETASNAEHGVIKGIQKLIDDGLCG